MQLTGLLHHVVDFCYPGVCAKCDSAADGPSPLCDACACDLEALAAKPGCDKCALPLATQDAPCPRCLGAGFARIDRISRLGTFDDPIKHLIHQLKYHNRWGLAEHLTDRLLGTARAKSLLAETDVILPVPLHPLRHIARGYNQAEIIASRIAARAKLPLSTSLVRLRNTAMQTEIHSQQKRIENLRDAFALKSPKEIKGKRVLLVDDVLTSGATLKSAARTVAQAMPANICALVLAVADRRRRGFEAV